MPAQEGKHYHYNQYEFWAERGMISLVDTDKAGDSSENAEQYHWRIPPGEFIKRAIAARIHFPDLHADKTAKLRKLLEDATAACKLAKQQGDPTDPSVLDHVVKHQRKRQIVLPHELPAMPGLTPEMKLKPKGKTAGDTLVEGVDVVPKLFGT